MLIFREVEFVRNSSYDEKEIAQVTAELKEEAQMWIDHMRAIETPESAARKVIQETESYSKTSWLKCSIKICYQTEICKAIEGIEFKVFVKATEFKYLKVIKRRELQKQAEEWKRCFCCTNAHGGPDFEVVGEVGTEDPCLMGLNRVICLTHTIFYRELKDTI